MWYRHSARAALLVVIATGCSSSDSSPPVGPTDPLDHPSIPAVGAGDVVRARHERLASRMARALRDPDFRTALLTAIERSPFPERKVHLQGFLNASGGRESHRLAQLSGDTDRDLKRDVDDAGPVEVYFPVAAHRRLWQGGTNLLVATAERDADAPVAFDLLGAVHRLDPSRPPSTPVLMVGRAELDFSGRPARIQECLFECGGGAGGGGGSTPPPTTTGLYMTAAKFSGTFEGWFKGDPEFEIHMLGQVGTTDGLTSYQCAGEHAGGPYAFDQNSEGWTGNVLLMSQTQIDQYKAAHPTKNLQIFVVEDDDGACVIKVDSARTSKMLTAVNNLYGSMTGGKDTTTSGIIRAWRKADGLYRVLKLVASWFTTNDDPVGNAVEDPIVAGSVLSGATWAVRGENAMVNGAIKLQMR